MGPLLASARFNSEVHAVWGHLVHYCIDPFQSRAERMSLLPKMWSVLVCGDASKETNFSLGSTSNDVQGLLNTTHQRRVLAFRLFKRLFLHEALIGDRMLPIRTALFTPSFLRSLAANISSVDSHLHRGSHALWSVLSRKRLSVQVCRHAWHLSGQSCVLIRSLMHMQLHATET